MLVSCTLAHGGENIPFVMPGLTSVPLATAPISPEKMISRVEIQEITFESMRKAALHLHPIPVLSFIEEGGIAFQIEGQAVQHLEAGAALYEPANVRIARLDNEGKTPARLIAFFMLGTDDHELVQRLSR